MNRSVPAVRALGALAIAFLAATACRTTKAPTERSFLSPEPPSAIRMQEDDWALRRRDVTPDLAAVTDPGTKSLEVELFDKERVTIVLGRPERIGRDGVVRSGTIGGDAATSASFALRGNSLAASIRTRNGRLFTILPLRDRLHRLAEIDQKRAPDRCGTEDGEGHTVNAREADTCGTDPADEIDALVVYTDDARAAAGSTGAIETAVYLAVAEANQTYANSGVDQRLRLVHVAEVDYAESGSGLTDRNRLKAKTDGFMDGVHTLRDTHAGDVVVLITESMETGLFGIAFIMGTVSNAFEDSAFCVVRRSRLTGGFTFAHELGHVMGARHDWAGDPTDNSPHHFNHGHGVPAPADPAVGAWRTVMARNALGGTRLPFWSNPDLDFPNGAALFDPMGTSAEPQPTDNTQTLNLTAPTVANFRCSSPSAPDVWMKDTWNDTGLEPDPATAGEEMYLSPYIWIRNTADTGLLQQHVHENPIAGAPNFVYVKLHNGGNAAADGALEVYAANASVSLTWPADWVLVGSVAVAGFTAHGTRIVESAWTPPGSGHYCLLARWVSAGDPMTVAEGPNIGVNVRNNNNLVWRNVNVIELSGDHASDEVSFAVRNPDRTPQRVGLRIAEPKDRDRSGFLRTADVRVRLDERLSAAWKVGGNRGSGFERDGQWLRIGPGGAQLDELVLPPGTEGRVSVLVRKSATTPRRRYELDFVQVDENGRSMGGVSYSIHVHR